MHLPGGSSHPSDAQKEVKSSHHQLTGSWSAALGNTWVPIASTIESSRRGGVNKYRDFISHQDLWFGVQSASGCEPGSTLLLFIERTVRIVGPGIVAGVWVLNTSLCCWFGITLGYRLSYVYSWGLIPLDFDIASRFMGSDPFSSWPGKWEGLVSYLSLCSLKFKTNASFI